jgi:hypothetical protein
MEEEGKEGKLKALRLKLERSKTIFIRLLSIDIGYQFILEKVPGWL